MMAGKPVVLSVSEIGEPIAPAEGIGDQDGLKDQALPEAFPEDLGPFVGAHEAELLLDDVDAFDFGDEFILDDGSRILVERTMGNAVHLADILLRRMTPAGCGIVLDERRLGRSPETVRDLLAAVALAHQLSNSMIPDIAFLRLFYNASLAISLGAQGRGDGPSLPPGRHMQESASDAKETSICELIDYSSGRPWYSSIESSEEELARLICEDVTACLKDMIYSGMTPGSSVVDSTSEPGSAASTKHSGRQPRVSRHVKGALTDLKNAPVAGPPYSSSPSPRSSVSVG